MSDKPADRPAKVALIDFCDSIQPTLGRRYAEKYAEVLEAFVRETMDAYIVERMAAINGTGQRAEGDDAEARKAEI